jgi:hypothetical protein
MTITTRELMSSVPPTFGLWQKILKTPIHLIAARGARAHVAS